jgi:hypothetical protein
MRWLEQKRSAAESETIDDTPSAAEIELDHLEELRQEEERLNEKRKQTQELKRLMHSMYAELEILRSRNEMLAAALGACYLCFGDDLTCPECNGAGVVGSLLPDADAFRHYVAPAVKRIRQKQISSDQM